MHQEELIIIDCVCSFSFSGYTRNCDLDNILCIFQTRERHSIRYQSYYKLIVENYYEHVVAICVRTHNHNNYIMHAHAHTYTNNVIL